MFFDPKALRGMGSSFEGWSGMLFPRWAFSFW